MKKKSFIFSGILIFLFLFSTTALAADVDIAKVAAQNAQKFGILTILPPFLAIVLAFITKNVVISLSLGVLSGSFLISLNGGNIFSALLNSFLDLVSRVLGSLADPWNAGIILQCMTIGGLIALISKMGGARAVAESLAKKAKTPMSAQIITWFLGLLVFFDDYANSLIVGPIMRPVTDKLKISREKLAFIVDGTAAPIAGIALISTWIGYEISLIKDAYASIGQTSVNAYGVFIQSIPYRFYNVLILIFIVLTAVLGREFGPMYKAERRARTTGKLLSDTAKPMVSSEVTALEPKEGIKLSIWNAIIPIGVLLIGAFAGFYFNGYNAIMGGEDKALINLMTTEPASFTAIREAFSASDASVVLFQAALFASIVAIVMGLSQKCFKMGEAIDIWIEGMKSLIITGVILLLAWSLSSVIKELGTAKFLVSILSNTIPAFLLPSIIFIFGSIISFATGTSYGTMGILMPLTIPLAYAISPDPNYVVLSASAVLTGAIFGDHCSPISDTTILSSMGSACDHLDHVKTQIYYSLTIAACAILFGYIPAGLGLPIYIVLPLAIILLVCLVLFVGKPVDVKDEKSSAKTVLKESANA
ncbi:malate-2H(+)/Na(+)-lactate antiporter [Clostridium acetireducens DSM 10703]|jgi:Na+/H+ antiporter NhaC|uniref:Malate-2H(+)/Na(+)-lactate antiporter n=1 Tax=Clostridium acetireducens DSM 10703 TaxID=1121290 RepID=A0A1E8EWC3_9CLOT|nr:Na+/H+ antiporter NhaC family protein [Clostridium acetireducens]OFI01559.1 malate-2H(+)/Na(+)-lactate antiporter [Clostridium acetireducens DSM 10703]